LKNFRNNTVVITGAASGIGRGLANKAADEGMNICIADMNGDALKEVEEELIAKGASVYACKLNVSDPEAMKAFARACYDRFASVELLFNNAGILRMGSSWDLDIDAWRQVFEVNIIGVINGVSAFVPLMIEQGTPAHVVNTGSVGSLVAAPGMAQYTTSKMAVRGITECLAQDLIMAELPISVSLLCPGMVSSNISEPWIRESLGDDADPALIAEMKAAVDSTYPNCISPEECAERVFDAVRQDKFWIFTHPFTQYYRKMCDAVIEGRNPEYSVVEFD
jgi:NADP-dependent 3-hydroxy acid dehydrogenase YdfG